MTPPELPSREARYFGVGKASWLEHVEGVWRTWRQDGLFSGVWDDPEDRYREFTILCEADGRLPWHEALEAMAAIFWPPVADPRPYENDQRSSERRRFADVMSEQEWLEQMPFPAFPHLRAAQDVDGLRAYIFRPDPELDALKAIETLAYLAIAGSEEAAGALMDCLEHAHYRVRCEGIEALAFVRWRKSGHGRGYKTLDQCLWIPRVPVNPNPPSIAPGLPFSDIAEKALSDEDPRVRCVGLRYVRLADPSGVVDNAPLRMAAISDPSPAVRTYALRALRAVRDPELMETAIAVSRDEDEDVSDWAFICLGEARSPKALTAILQAARRPDRARFHYVEQALLCHLERTSSSATKARIEKVVMDFVRDQRWRSSMYLPALLEELSSEAGRGLLTELQGDPDPKVQEALRAWEERKADAERFAQEDSSGSDEYL